MAKILIVDDSEPNRDMLARRLKRKGHVICVAGDGLQAVDMTRSEKPDLVLMDLNLPVLDGWSATRQIKSHPGTRSMPIIALTAHAMSGDRQKALQAGCDDYATKPVDFARLLEQIDSLAAASQADPVAELSPEASADTATAAAEQAEEVVPEAEAGSGSVTESPGEAGLVLVVDDTEANRHVAARWLRRRGFSVDTASGGAEALELVVKRPYDVVLLDVMMPGVDGLQVLRTIRQNSAATELPVVMATARDASDDVVEALNMGANDYVTKPLDFPVLLARLQTQVSLKRSVEQIRRLEQGLEQRNADLEAATLRTQKDLEAAARVQASLLPQSDPKIPGYNVSWLFQPTAELAGDIFNVFELDDEQVGLYVLDVSGHGVAASLLSVTVSRFLSPARDPSSILWRMRDEATTPPPGSNEQPISRFHIETPAKVAQRLTARFPFDRSTQFFTMMYGVLNTRRHRLHYASAGHPDVLYIPAHGEAQSLPGWGFPIGVGGGEYEEHTLELAKGDRIYIHSDGMSEAISPSGELFGMPRMLTALSEARGQSLEQSLKDLSEQIIKWTGSNDRTDDQTVLALERVSD